MDAKKSKTIKNILWRLPLDIELMIIDLDSIGRSNSEAFLQKCTNCNRFDRYKRTIFAQRCKNGCGALLCYFCKKESICPNWVNNTNNYSRAVSEYYIKLFRNNKLFMYNFQKDLLLKRGVNSKWWIRFKRRRKRMLKNWSHR